MKTFSAYCKYCGIAVTGKVNAITELDSGNYLYIGECEICLYEIRRIVPNEKFIDAAYDDMQVKDFFRNGNENYGDRSWNGL
jgi:hypothetical protein